tara:strand:- start:61188 stop:62165 length:978 start_codon:yes stop_codon:yes gene_type:complete
MGFLDNSGDIILDAVLTDAGRKRLARGDGTFRITKYAFGDDEIDYGKYDPNHASGSAYFDLEILQTPILEAFTNNRSSVKYKLMSLTNNNLLYLPEIVLNTVADNTARALNKDLLGGSGSFYVAVDNDTVESLEAVTTAQVFIDGSKYLSDSSLNQIRTDQGLNSTKLSAVNHISSELEEQQYLIEIDNRFGTIYDIQSNGTPGTPSFIDDDQVASYYVTFGVGTYVQKCKDGPLATNGNIVGVGGKTTGAEVLPGPRGTKLQFGIRASDNLRTSTYLFTTLGTTMGSGPYGAADSYYTLDAVIRITGVTTGYRMDIPIRFVRKV